LSAADAAALLNVSRNTVVDANTVRRRGTPDEIAAVERGADGDEASRPGALIGL
jgi:hypothetical protein